MRKFQAARITNLKIARRLFQGLTIVWFLIGGWTVFTIIRDWTLRSEIFINGTPATDQEVRSFLAASIGITFVGGILLYLAVRRLTGSINVLQHKKRPPSKERSLK